MPSETILIVNDVKGVRELAREFLEHEDYVILVAKDGAEALEICERHEGQIDLLLSDVEMPGMSGQDLAERLTRLRPEMKVIYMSGTPKVALALGSGTIFLRKPFSIDTLARTVREVLETKKG